MSRRLLWALLLIAVTVVVALLNGQNAVIHLKFASVSLSASFAYLSFFAVGLVTGILLR
ncbi:MAG: hypothetical protein U1E27_01325 [Kiritimatiellia bacterium]|nr:hypothetical protein [Kiritimatiellia bacterium]